MRHGGVVALGNPIEPEEPHNVIDTQGSAVSQGFSDRFGIQSVTVLTMLPRIGWRERPVLAGRRKVIRRRPDAAPGYVKRAVRPQVGATAIGGESKIVIQADPHSRLARVLLDLGELAVHVPLQPAVEKNLALMFGGKPADGV